MKTWLLFGGAAAVVVYIINRDAIDAWIAGKQGETTFVPSWFSKVGASLSQSIDARNAADAAVDTGQESVKVTTDEDPEGKTSFLPSFL